MHCLTDDCQCRTFLIRDVMDEMMLNGLVPDRVFLELSIMHCMRSSRIGDCFFYYNEMKRRGMQPSAKLQGLLISVLAREGHLQAAEEVRSPRLPPCPQTPSPACSACTPCALRSASPTTTLQPSCSGGAVEVNSPHMNSLH